MRLLYAEDEKSLARAVSTILRKNNYSVDVVYDGQAALDYLRAADYDGAILDVMMPKADGFSVLARLRAEGIATPVLFLTARDTVEDRVHGLDLGASDYLVKPFSMAELLARVRALLRQGSGASSSVLTVGDLRMDLAAHTVSRGGRPISLSAREFSLLAYFMHNPNIVLSREKIEDHVWNFEYEGGTNVVDVYVRYLRRKIDEGEERKLLHTVRGSGYVLRGED